MPVRKSPEFSLYLSTYKNDIMHFEKDYVYHIYNRSNETVFFNEDNYLFFIKKYKKFILPYADLFAWCLMPNHFHFMLSPNAKGVKYVGDEHLPSTQILSKQFGTYLSSYTKAYNKRHYRRGSLWSHNTKSKQLNFINNSYPASCFRYIHNNPVHAGLVNRIEDWKYSSYLDFSDNREGSFVNKELAFKIINCDPDNFVEWSKGRLSQKQIDGIF